MLRQPWRDQTGLTTVEYALLLMLIAAVSFTLWTLLGAATSSFRQRLHRQPAARRLSRPAPPVVSRPCHAASALLPCPPVRGHANRYATGPA